MRTISVLLLGVLLSACGAGLHAAVRPKAAEGMQCEESKLKFEPIGNVEQSGVFYVEGCGKIGRYGALCNALGYCPEPAGEVVSEKVLRQAAFDLSCGEKDLSIVRINSDTFGAVGCEKKASYLLVDCGRSNGCRVVQNTQSQ